MKTTTAYWFCQVAGWGAYTAMGMFMAARETGWVFHIVASYVLFFFYSVALTELLRREIRRRNWLNASYGLLRVLSSAPLLAGVQLFLICAIDLAFQGVGSHFLKHPSYIFFAWMSLTGADGMWALFYVTLTSKRHFREKEVHLQLSLREAELRALEAQLNPHFLFNCLNSVRALVTENPQQAQEMITRLANILRSNLHRDLNHKVTLASEMELASDYLALESIRFEERLRVQFAIEAGATKVLVPPMLLQTLLENALKHGIAPRPAGGDLSIRARLEGERLILEVENTGQLSGHKPDDTQFGLKNIRERLRILYGDGASLAVRNRDSEHVAATVLIPRTA